ncbi:MAG: biotin/lipoyl-binding protein, partial [Acidobacteria bacterium]|nr:biotin/lipoyl-binding protein [Acidobacteriota bacterium]
MSGRKTRRWIGLLILLVIILAGGGIAYVRMNAAPPEVDEKNLAAVVRGDLARSVVATGVVEPISNRIEIRSKASGIVEKIHVDVGDKVSAGQVLVELDRYQLMAQLREA